MDLQKVKEALIAAREELPEYSSAPLGREPQAIRACRLVSEALAELENHEEGALSTVIKWAEGYFDHDIITGAIHESLAILLNQYAESYHAKKCESCKAKQNPYKLFGDTSNAPPECLRCGLPCPADCPLDNEENA